MDSTYKREKNCDWTNHDYNQFLIELKRMDIPVYEMMYPYLTYLMNLSKKTIRRKLKELDLILETHIFDKERILIPINSKEDGKKELKYKLKMHKFDCSDMIRFVETVYSKVMQTGNIAFTNYQNAISKMNHLDEKINYLNLLLDLVNQKDEEVLSIILKPYYSYISKICDNKKLYPLVQGKEEEILSVFKYRISLELEKLNDAKERSFRAHSHDLNLRITDYQLRRDIHGRKFKG